MCLILFPFPSTGRGEGKDGAGKGNWGSKEDAIDAATSGGSKSKKEDGGDDAAEEEVEEEEPEVQVSYEDFMKAKADAAKKLPQANIRSAGEGGYDGKVGASKVEYEEASAITYGKKEAKVQKKPRSSMTKMSKWGPECPALQSGEHGRRTGSKQTSTY